MNKRKRQDDELYKRTRKWAIERDNGLCVICGGMASEVHHIVFRSQMGLSNLSNLACLCRECHNNSHGTYAKEIRKYLQDIIEERTKDYERNSSSKSIFRK